MCHMMLHMSNKPTMLHVNEGGVCVSHDVACEQQTYNATCKRGRHVCVCVRAKCADLSSDIVD